MPGTDRGTRKIIANTPIPALLEHFFSWKRQTINIYMMKYMVHQILMNDMENTQ